MPLPIESGIEKKAVTVVQAAGDLLSQFAKKLNVIPTPESRQRARILKTPPANNKSA